MLVEDSGPIHVSKATTAAFKACEHWLQVEWLTKYAPELNDIEIVWGDLKAHHLAHQTFSDPETLDRAIHFSLSYWPHFPYRLALIIYKKFTIYSPMDRRRFHREMMFCHHLCRWTGNNPPRTSHFHAPA